MVRNQHQVGGMVKIKGDLHQEIYKQVVADHFFKVVTIFGMKSRHEGYLFFRSQFCRHLPADKGTMRMDRVKSRQKTTPIEALKDAKSAIRYLRQNAAELGIDPDKIAVSGGSAGGHLAAACSTNLTINDASDDLVFSSQPNALVLFNPVIDNSAEGYGYDRIKDYYPEFSPIHNIRKGFPPTAFFVGTNDNLIPVKTAELFKQKIELVGSRCDLFLYKDQVHGFFNQPILHADILSKVDAFLQSIGYMD
jgi:acetyl esterase/lipase